MLYFETPVQPNFLTTPLSDAYVVMDGEYSRSTPGSKCVRLHWKVYYNKAAFTAGLNPISRGNLPDPFDKDYFENTNESNVDAFINAKLNSGVKTMLKNFVEGKLGAENVTWDE